MPANREQISVEQARSEEGTGLSTLSMVRDRIGGPGEWFGRLDRPVDAAPLAYFRFVFGAIMVWEVYRYWSKGWIERYYVEPDIFFTYSGFGWIAPWPEPFMHVHFAVLAVLAAAMALGLAYRISASLFAVGFCYVFLLDQANYLNHFYLIGLLSLLLAVVPAHRFASLDSLLQPGVKSRWVPAWSLWIIRFQLAVVYVYGGIAKMNGDWLSGRPMVYWLRGSGDTPLIGSFLESAIAPVIMSWSGMLLDLFVVPALLWKRTRIPALLALAAFHLTNSAVFSIGIFPWFMLLATPVFFAGPWRVGRLGILPERPVSSPLRVLGRALLTTFVLWQLLMPFRHFLYPGNVSWTEEGHNFAWHMKLRDKSGRVQFRARDPQTGETWLINHKEYLSARQARKMTTRPQMMAQFARKVAPMVGKEKGLARVEIQARALVSLNGRRPQPLVDSRVDLARARWGITPSSWVLPLEAGPRAEE